MIIRIFKRGLLLVVLMGLQALQVFAQPVTLVDCRQWVRKNYPLIKKLDYIRLNTKYLNINANKAYFPQFNVNGQATYQSDVTTIPQIAPNITLPTLDKDQYRIQGELVQTIFDGGYRTTQINMIRSAEQIQTQQVEVSLHAVQQQVTDLYFAVLMFDGQLKQHAIQKSNLKNTLEKTQAGLKEGTISRNSVNELKAELVNADITETELRSNRQALIEILEQLTGREFLATTVFTEPPVPSLLISGIKRSELKLLDLQKAHIAIQKKQAASDLLPTLSAFAMGGYGRPTLNMLSNSFGTYWMAGLRLKWSINTLMSLPNTLKSLQMNDKMLDVDKETFTLNTQIALNQETSTIRKYKTLLEKDDEAIQLREAVLKSAKAQLENGVITTTDYLTQLNAENLAKEIRELHRLQLLKAQYQFLIISGN